jgi:hypothetical protein
MMERGLFSFALVSALFMLGSCAERTSGPASSETTGAEPTATSPSPNSTLDSSAPTANSVYPPVTPEGPIEIAPPQ